MSDSAESSQVISVAPAKSRRPYGDEDDEELQFIEGHESDETESSWTPYIDERERQMQEELELMMCESFTSEGFSPYSNSASDLDSPIMSAKKLYDRKNSIKNRMDMIKMRKPTVKYDSAVDGELEDTASSPHNSPTVWYMNQLEMMRLKNNSNSHENKGKGSSKTGANVLGDERKIKGKDPTELPKRGKS